MPDVDLKEILGEDIVKRIEDLEGKATEVTEKLETVDGDEETKALKDRLASIETELAPLQGAAKDAAHDAEMKAMRDQAGELKSALDELRKPSGSFNLGGSSGSSDEGKAQEFYGSREKKGQFSFYNDVAAAEHGDRKAASRVKEVQDELEGKAAMTEGTAGAGGFLVPDQVSSELLELRQYNATLRPLLSSVGITSDVLRMTQVTGGLTAGWVAELASKPEAELTFAEITASVFTVAGLSVTSNQLLRDSNAGGAVGPGVDSLINRDLSKRIETVVEIALLDGTGTGQPLGIARTVGINAVPYTDGSPTVPELLDKIVDAITAVYTNYLGAPNAIVMHPRTWAFIVKGRELTSPSTYLIGSGGAFGRRGDSPLPGYGNAQVPKGELFGLPVYTTPNVPTTYSAGAPGAGTESFILVGDFSQGLVLDRQGIQFDQSSHVFFTTNQTVFRAEEAVGFTAARFPKAFSLISGTGLAGN